MLNIEDPQNWSAGLYIRLSREDDSEGPSRSVCNQLSLLEEFVRQNGLAVYDTYIDDGVSGTGFDRPAFNRLLRDIEGGRVNLVITKDLSRLGRDYIMTGHYMERYFPEHQVRYISLLDGVDTGADTSANDVTPFRAIMNDMYAKDVSRKTRSVKHDKQRKGLFIGGKPVYGYKMHPTEKNRIVVDNEVSPVVENIFALALAGQSCRTIAQTLNGRGIPPPGVYAHLPAVGTGPCSGLWSSEAVARLLRNETYMGSMVQGRTVKASYKSRKCIRQPPEKWIVVPHTHAPIVDEETFRRVQLLLDSRRHTRSRTYDFPLKGLIFCHECGHPLGVINRKNTRGEDVLYFVCRTWQRFTHAGACTGHCIKEERVTAAVTEELERLLRPWLQREYLLPTAKAVLEEKRRREEKADELAAARRRLAALSANLDRMYLDCLGGDMTGEELQRLRTKAGEEKRRLESRIKALEVRRSTSPGETAEALTGEFLKEALKSREVLAGLLRRVELTEDRQVLLYCRFSPPGESVRP